MPLYIPVTAMLSPMRPDWDDDRLESVSQRIDRAADRLRPRSGPQVVLRDRDLRLTRLFPYFVGLCLLIWLATLLYLGDYSIGKVIEILCLSFVACFAVLGVPCSLLMDRGAFSNWVPFLLAIAMAGLLWLAGVYMGHVYYAEAIDLTMGALGIELGDLGQLVLGFGGTIALIYFTSVGVLSIIGAYMRRYTAKVFLSMQDHADQGIRGKAEWFFMVPDIIDVKEVVLEPVRSPHRFNVRACVSVTAYLFVLGLLVSSYLFVNPLLISLMDWQTMLAIMLMLSMFTPALVLPWQIVRGVGAKVRSDAPRDFYLWTGAKRRLFSTFAMLGVFMMMFVLSVYLGNSVEDILRTYVSFLIPLLATSAMYGALYENNFDRGICDKICDDFGSDAESREDP